MKLDDLDRILSGEEEILPSSGFSASVMGAVRREASAPPPIPFPWKRALPGMAAAALALVMAFIGFMELIRGTTAPQVPAALPPVVVSILQATLNAATGWIILVLLLSLAMVKLSMRLTSGRA